MCLLFFMNGAIDENAKEGAIDDASDERCNAINLSKENL